MHQLFILCDVNKTVVTINKGGAYGGQVAEEALQHPECQRLAEGERRKYGWKDKISYYFLFSFPPQSLNQFSQQCKDPHIIN